MSIYRILGLLAAMSHRMSRLRINFVPLNVGVFILLAVVAHKGVKMMGEARTSDPAAQRLTVRDVLADPSSRQPHIELHGFIDAGVVLESGRKQAGKDVLSRVDEQFAPIVDETGRRAADPVATRLALCLRHHDGHRHTSPDAAGCARHTARLRRNHEPYLSQP